MAKVSRRRHGRRSAALPVKAVEEPTTETGAFRATFEFGGARLKFLLDQGAAIVRDQRLTIAAPPSNGATPHAPLPRHAGLVPVPGRRLSEVPDEDGGPDWLWEERLPSGAVVCVEGDPDLGKSFLTLDLASRVSTGSPMPFETERRSAAGVVLANAEDRPGVVKARARAAGIDLDRVRILTGSECGGLLGDLDRLEAAIMSVQAKMVVVDPLMAALGRATNARVDQSVRKELSPLSDLAGRLGTTIVLVRHLTKGAGSNAKYRGSGSIGLTGAFRSQLAVTEHPERRDERLVSWVKHNWGAKPAPITYRIVSAGKVARVEWLEQLADSAVPEHRGAR